MNHPRRALRLRPRLLLLLLLFPLRVLVRLRLQHRRRWLHRCRSCRPAPSGLPGIAGAPIDRTRTGRPSAVTRLRELWGGPRLGSPHPRPRCRRHVLAKNFRRRKATARRSATSKPLLSNPGHQSFHCSSSVNPLSARRIDGPSRVDALGIKQMSPTTSNLNVTEALRRINSEKPRRNHAEFLSTIKSSRFRSQARVKMGRIGVSGRVY